MSGIKKFLTYLLFIACGIGVVALILFSINYFGDKYFLKDKEEAVTESPSLSSGIEGDLTEEALKTEEETTEEEIQLTPEEMEAKYWEEEWTNPIATPADATFKYEYHSFEYTENTVELRPYMEIFEEKKAYMESQGIEVILADDKDDDEETTEIGPDGEPIEKPEPNLSIYNQLRLESLPDAANPYIEGEVISPDDIEGDYEPGG
ncbi:MAG: hypothetical protein J6Z74_04055, partial [Eubacterium sp.]|nr:hypothetical protein [Eubacterium sp.]